MDWDLLRKHVADGVINEQRHAYLPLSIFNYSQRCQFERLWDDVTLQCRGLIAQGNRIVARPFRKFFNDTEHPEDHIPWHIPCEVTEKLDGSLLIVFSFDGEWHYATRGSFTSEQAARGRDIFRRRYSEGGMLDDRFTYLFEVIYPENRIVVDYGGKEDVILLGAIVPETGEELRPQFMNECLTKVRTLPPTASAKELRSIIRDDEEGYVIRFDNGFRVKVKGQRYMELHKLICGVSSRSIWEALSTSKSIEEMLAVIPDEFGDWVREERTAQLAAFDALNAQAEAAYLAVKDLPDRKSKAIRIMADFRDVSSAAFAAIDGKPTASILWKQLYPEFRRPRAAIRMET